jgi:uncharacterized protein
MTIVSRMDWMAASGNLGRIVAAKLTEGVDLVEGIYSIAREYGLKSGNVVAIGSLKSAVVAWPTSMDVTRPLGETETCCTLEGPVEMGTGWGVFGTDDKGELHMHFHALLMDKNGLIRCGNLRPRSAPVMATVDLSIYEFMGLVVKPVFHPVRKNIRLVPQNCE